MALAKTVTVKEEFERNPELKESDLEMLRDWLKKQPHLPPMSDSELILFLHSNYYRIEPAKKTIDTFFTLRTHVPEFFTKRDPVGTKELQEIMKVVSYVLLPGTTPEGYRVLYLKIIDPDPSRYVYVDGVKLLCMFMELWFHTEGTNQGDIILFDLSDIVFGHVARLSPMVTKKFLYYLQDALPVRLKGLHVMNVVPFIDTIMRMMKPFMKKELLDMLVLHTSSESLNKKIPIDLLPNDQGGKAGALVDLWSMEKKRLEEHRAWFQEQEKRKVNESVRPGKAKNATDIFGVEGSFKKLDID